jgi:hypothetical protein
VGPLAPAPPLTDVSKLVTTRFQGDDVSRSISARSEIWTASYRAFSSGPDVPGASNLPPPVRSMFGYGPDTFRYVFPLERPSGATVLEYLTSEAHDEYLNRLVEVGAIGLAAYLTLVAAAAATALWVIRRARARARPAAGALAAGILGALAGRAVEQLFGVPQAGDTLILWLALGLLAGLSAVFLTASGPAAAAPGVKLKASSKKFRRPAQRALVAAAVMAALAAAIGVGWLAWSKNVNYLRANTVAAHAVAVARTDMPKAVALLEDAESLAPDVALYPSLRATAFRAISNAKPSPEADRAVLRAAYEADQRALEINPLELEANFVAAYGAWRLATAYEPERILDAIELYERLALLAPSHPLVGPRLGGLYQLVKVSPAGQ